MPCHWMVSGGGWLKVGQVGIKWQREGVASRDVWGTGSGGVESGAGWVEVQVAGVRWEGEGVGSREVWGAGT